MRENGRVLFRSKETGMFIIKHSDGYALVEILGSEDEIELNDIISGDWDAEGCEPLYKEGKKFEAYFQGSWGDFETAVHVCQQ